MEDFFALLLAFTGIFLFIFIFALLISYVVSAITFYKLAQKAHLESEAWMAWVPVLNIILFLHIIGRSGWYCLLLIIPGLLAPFAYSDSISLLVLILSIVQLVFLIIWYIDFLKRFGQHPAWLLLNFIPIGFMVFLLYMAFSDQVQYQAPMAQPYENY